jgi:hypothetical protein
MSKEESALIELDNRLKALEARIKKTRELEARTYFNGRRGGDCKSKIAHHRDLLVVFSGH